MPEFLFVADQLWLDFVNTEMMEGSQRIDLLSNLNDVGRWLSAAAVIKTREQRELLNVSGQSAVGRQLFESFITLRSALAKIAAALANGEAAPSSAIALLNEALRSRPEHPQIVRRRDEYELRYQADQTEPAHLLVPIAESAAELLASGKLDRVKKCGSPNCILYIYDTTKSHTRQWCQMATCGNRMKASAFYRRRRSKVKK